MSDKTVDEIMGLVKEYAIHTSEDPEKKYALEAAITALVAERDQAVVELSLRCTCKGYSVPDAPLMQECYPHQVVRQERDALKARVVELEKEIDSQRQALIAVTCMIPVQYREHPAWQQANDCIVRTCGQKKETP